MPSMLRRFPRRTEARPACCLHCTERPRDDDAKRAEAMRRVEPLDAARIAAIFDLHGRCAYSLAMMLTADQGRAEAAIEEAFRILQYDADVPVVADERLRLRLLQLVYAAAIKHEAERPVRPSLHPAASVNALPPGARQVLALCLHGVTCAALDASERSRPGTSILRLHRALGLIRDARLDVAAT